MPRDKHYIAGTWYRRDDRSGFKCRSFDTEKEWNGLWIRRDMFEERQPQDFVRGIADEQAVPEPRPTPAALYLGPTITTLNAAANAAATTIVVASTANMSNGDVLEVLCGTTPDQQFQFRTTITTVLSSTSLLLAGGLPYAASSGNQVTDITASTTVIASDFPASSGQGPGGTGLP